MGVTAWFRCLARCEYGGSIVEYVGVSGLALLVTGWIIVTISAQRFTIGNAMANIHARQIASFESGLGGTANTNAQLYPRVTPPTIPIIGIPRLFGSEQASSWWDWLWQEREWTWYRDLMEKWSNSGWLGWLSATIFGFLLDLVAGISANGEFRWGWLILSLISTLASIFGVGLLGKIPGLAKYLLNFIKFIGGARVAKFIDDLIRWGTKLIDYLTKARWLEKLKLEKWFKWVWDNADRMKELILGKWGTWAKELTRLLPHIKQWLPKWLQDLLANKTIIEFAKHLFNLAWDTATKGLTGTVEFILKRLIKDSPLKEKLEALSRLITLDSLRDIAQSVSEKWQDFTTWINDQLRGGRTTSKP